MARKKGFDYFDAMLELAVITEEAALALKTIVMNYDWETVGQQAEEIRALEKAGDEKVDEIMTELHRSFITPIEREDIAMITDCIDDVLDGINAIPFLLKNFVVTAMRPKTEEMAQHIYEASQGLRVVVEEFPKFKNSKTLGQMIVKVNDIEEQGDHLYGSLILDLFSNEKDVLEVVKWKNVYEKLEKIIDQCETTVDMIAALVIKNS